MHARCESCGTSQWRGLFREPALSLRYAVINGVALGVCGSATKLLFARFGLTTDGWRNGLASLGVCAVLMLALYIAAFFADGCAVRWLRCRACGARRLRPELGDQGAGEIVVGGLYATRDEDGTYRILKVLAVDERAVHLRCYADRFEELPTQVSSSALSLGGLGSPERLGTGHFPLAREAFEQEERHLVGREPVADDELDGYRIWAGEHPGAE